MARYLPPMYPYNPFFANVNPENANERWYEKGDLYMFGAMPYLNFGGTITFTPDDPSLDWTIREELATIPGESGDRNVSYFFAYIHITENGYYDLGLTRGFYPIGGTVVTSRAFFYKKVSSVDYTSTTVTDSIALDFNNPPPSSLTYYDACAFVVGCPGNSNGFRPDVSAARSNDTWAIGGNNSGSHRVYGGMGGSWGVQDDSGYDGPPYLEYSGDGVGIPSTAPLQSSPYPYITDYYDDVLISYDEFGQPVYYTGENTNEYWYWFGDALWLRGSNIKGAGWKIGAI